MSCSGIILGLTFIVNWVMMPSWESRWSLPWIVERLSPVAAAMSLMLALLFFSRASRIRRSLVVSAELLLSPTPLLLCWNWCMLIKKNKKNFPEGQECAPCSLGVDFEGVQNRRNEKFAKLIFKSFYFCPIIYNF